MPRIRHAITLITAAMLAGCSDTNGPVDVDPPPGTRRSSTGVRIDGMTRVLVIPARFADGLPAPFTAAELQQRLFGSGTSGLAARGYRLASNDKFALRGDVAPWMQTTITTETASQPGTVAPLRFGDHLVEAIVAADAHVDYGRYDSDGPDGIANSGDDDGFIDGGIIVLGSELDRRCMSGTGRGPHPHAVLSPSQLSKTNQPVKTSDASANGGTISIRAYTTMSATDCGGAGTNHAALTHELGHLLFGLPDLYHVVDNVPISQIWRGRRWVLGCWELMAAGSGWGCGIGEPPITVEPAALGAWSRASVGWAVPEELSTNEEAIHELTSLERGGTVLKLVIGPGEYLLAEYRQPTAGDLGIPGNGLLLYHVTESLPTVPPSATEPRQYRVMLIEADDDGALVRTEPEGGDRGQASDAFGSVTAFGIATHSAARSSSGAPLPFTIDQISIDVGNGRARFRVRPD